MANTVSSGGKNTVEFNHAVILAQQTEKAYGVPASVTLAQYIQESGWGTSSLARNNNNYFGIKAGSGWASYPSMDDSFEAHGKLLAGSIYSDKTAGTKTPEEYIDAIAETYCPGQGYAAAIKQLMADYNLNQYNVNATVSGSNTTQIAPDNPVDSITGPFKDAAGGIIKFMAAILLGGIALVFFMVAFGGDDAPAKVKSKAIAKAVGG